MRQQERKECPACTGEGLYSHTVSRWRKLCGRRGSFQQLQRQKRKSATGKLAAALNQVWSWDITKLKEAAKWIHYYMYVILDIFSRYCVGWIVAYWESARLAEKLIGETCLKQCIEKGQLTIPADRGSSMKLKLVALLLSNLEITKTHSRLHIRNDNPYSESQFKTLKYAPELADSIWINQPKLDNDILIC